MTSQTEQNRYRKHLQIKLTATPHLHRDYRKLKGTIWSTQFSYLAIPFSQSVSWEGSRQRAVNQWLHAIHSEYKHFLPFSTKCFGELGHKVTIKLSRQVVKRCVQLCAQLIWLLDICLCLQQHIKMFFPYFNYRFSFFNHTNTFCQLQYGEKIFRLFFIFWGGSVWAWKIKSSNMKAEVINPSSLLSQSNLFLSSLVMEANKLACFRPRLSREIGFWWDRYSSCALSTPFLSSPALPFLFAWSEQKAESAGATVLSLRQVKRPQCVCQ